MDSHRRRSRERAQLVGDPVDTLSGAVVDRSLDFRLTGSIELRWTRHYDSSQCDCLMSAGRGWAHEYDRTLTIDAEGLRYVEPNRTECRFPRLDSDGTECAVHGLTLRRISRLKYIVVTHAHPAMEFVFHPPVTRARLSRLLAGSSEVGFNYDGANRLISIRDSVGRMIRVEEHEDERLASLTLQQTSGKSDRLLMTYHYDERGNLVRTENGDGYGHLYAYDQADRLIERRGRRGFRFYFRYDDQGRCIRSMGDDRLFGVVMNYVVPGRMTKVTRPDGGVWTYSYSVNGELNEIHDPKGGTRKFVRDAAGRVALEVDPVGNATRFVYDSAGAPTAKIDPLGRRIALPEDPNAPDPMVTGVAANAAEYEYGRLLTVDSISLPGVEQVQTLSLPAYARSAVFASSTEAVAAKASFDIPPLRILWWPRPTKGRVFNELGKLLRQHDQFGRVRHWSYDESGNVAEHRDFDGGRWSYDYPAWHFLRGLTNPAGDRIHYTYTSYGQVASFTDGAGTRSEYRYDLKGFLVEVVRHGEVRDTYTRDAGGNLIAKHAADGRELLRIETGPGNLRKKRILASGDEHSFRHDGSGRPISAESKNDRVALEYDMHGNTVTESCNGMGVEYRFQGWRRPAASVILGRFEIGYRWGEQQTLVLVDPSGSSHDIQFFENGIVESRLAGGIKECAQYDDWGRCLFKCTDFPGSESWTRRYEWSGEGELRQVEDNVRGKARHDYDSAHRLRGRHVNGTTEQYVHDPADNLLAQPGLAGVELDGNRLLAANEFTFSYDDRNNMSLRRSPDGVIRYHYDSRDQLTSIDTPGGLWQAEYDPFGRRTRKVFQGRTTKYLWYGDQLTAEIQPDGRLRIYVYTDPLALVPLMFFDFESIDSPPESGQRYFVFTDQIGTPCLVVGSGQQEVWRADIAPYGQVTLGADQKIEFNLRFPGHYADPEVALHYNRHRYYDPVLGRYLQSDPWGISGGSNLYAYRTNPLLDVDVLGLGEEGSPSPKSREDDAEGTGEPGPTSPSRMSDEQLQSAADHVRHGGKPNPNDWSTLTVTEGMENGRPVHTVTSSRSPRGPGGNLTDGEVSRAREVFGDDVRTPPPGRNPPGENTNHSEQRGARATQDQTDRRQASSNQTATTRRDPDVGHMGAACGPCAACQGSATNSSGEPNPITNVTGTIEDGGRTNMPEPGAWRR